ncbi:hypothetical protein BS47DRAFT_1361732 [Hydnum rufescens UP504]|uniref:Uncharacterized protein n=1 Tax=Hydnum rufescens UP504 TaxID=1448309 RepID=A0A9P6AYH1_9AGAM|nr:hypothetical protein BS47DRAFT_1361732 [Hydnum rufescens UP504]
MPCPHFGVNDKLIGAVFCMEDLEDSCVSGVVRGLEQDGVPVFVVTILELWSEMVWDRIPCLKTPWRNMTNVSPGLEHGFLLISVEYAVPFDHPFPWFLAPTYGYPGFYYQYRDEKYYEEQAFLEALVVVDPQQESIPLLTKSYEVVAKFLGLGPFFCARNPPISVFLLTNPNAPGVLESAQINPPLDPLLTTLALAPPQMVLDNASDFQAFLSRAWLVGSMGRGHSLHTSLPKEVSSCFKMALWATVSIDFKRHIVTYMDSIFLPSTFEFVTEIMQKYLADLTALKTCSFDLEAWTFIGSKDTVHQPWKVLHPPEVPSARLQFMVDVVWGVINYPQGYDHALQSIFPSHSPPAFILPNEPDYIHVPCPTLPCPVPKIMPAPMPAVATVTPSRHNEQPSPQQHSWGDITENEGCDLIWNAAAGDVASYQRIMVVLDHHLGISGQAGIKFVTLFGT